MYCVYFEAILRNISLIEQNKYSTSFHFTADIFCLLYVFFKVAGPIYVHEDAAALL